MSAGKQSIKELFLVFGGALFTGISSVVSGIVLFRVFAANETVGPDIPVQAYFVVGVIFQMIIATLVLTVRIRIFGQQLPSIAQVGNDIRGFDFTAHVYAIASAITGGIAILLIVLPAYGKFGPFITAVLYVTVPALANGVVDFFWNVPRRTKPLFGAFLLVSLIALFVMASQVVFDSSTISAFFSGLFSNGELILGMVVSFGLFIMLSDQSLNSGIKYVKTKGEPLYPDLSFAYLRIVWMAVLGAAIGISEAIGHGGLQSFMAVLNDAVKLRLLDLLLFVGIVHLAGVLVNFAKALLLNTFQKTPSEIAVAFGISSIVAFVFTWYLVTNTHGFLKDQVFDSSTLPQKLIATAVIVVLVYGLALFKKR